MSSTPKRLLGVTATKPIIIGTYSLTKSVDASGTASAFQWTCLVRSGESEDEDISEYIRRVEFNLHSTFAQPRRVVESPPFQVEEQGWGEFEIHLRIFFQDTNERPLDVKHWLKLRPEPHETLPGVDYTKVPVVSEVYDEIQFQAPHEWFYEKLCAGASVPSGLNISYKLASHPLYAFMKSPNSFKREEDENRDKLIGIEQFIRNQINNHQSQILLADSDYRAFRDHFFKYNNPE
jgi:YEATS domain-containing protein 4